jgi:hypothetical protein
MDKIGIDDIGKEIDRILSSKINTDLLISSLNLSLLNSPSVRKKSRQQKLVSPSLSSSRY